LLAYFFAYNVLAY